MVTIVFRDSFFDIEDFGPDRQEETASAIQKQALAAFEDFKKA